MNRITSKERIIIERFKPYKVIDIYRNGKLIYTVKTENTAATLEEIKRQYRHNVRINQAGGRFKRLAVADGEKGFYSLRYCNYYENMASEYAAIKQLKEQLEREHTGTIRVETATTKKDYHKQFKIVYVKWAA